MIRHCVRRISGSIFHDPVTSCAGIFDHNKPRPKPGIHKRPICAAIAGITSEIRVPDYWGEAVGDTVSICYHGVSSRQIIELTI